MRKRISLIALCGLAVTLLVHAPLADAGTVVGNECIGSQFMPGQTVIQIARAPGVPLPVTAPGPGVVTNWTVNSGLSERAVERLKVFREYGNVFRAVGQSPEVFANPGPNEFDARIPIQAGDRFGLHGRPPAGGLECFTAGLFDFIGRAVGDVPLGGLAATATNAAGRVTENRATVKLRGLASIHPRRQRRPVGAPAPRHGLDRARVLPPA